MLVTYGGNPEPVNDSAGTAGWEELADGVIVAGQPGGAPSWFPCNDRPSNKASYRISDHGAGRLSRWSRTARLVDRIRRASATTWVYEQTEPMATYLATVQIGRYQPIATVRRSGPNREPSCRPTWSPRLPRHSVARPR